MDFYTLVSVGIIVLIIFLIYKNSSKKQTEHFKKKSSASKSISKATKSVSKGAKKASKSASKGAKKATKSASKGAKKATKSASKGVKKSSKSSKKSPKKSSSKPKATVDITDTAILNSIDTTKETVTDTQKIIDRTIKTNLNVKNSITSLDRKIESLKTKVKTANQKKVFALYLIKKTTAKIAYLNNLVAIVPTFASKTWKQNEILKRKIYLQIYAVKYYIIRTNSYNCQTSNLFAEIESNYTNVIETYNEIQNQIIRLNAMISNTSKSVSTANDKIINTNNLITNANQPTDSVISSEDSGSEDSGSEEVDTGSEEVDAGSEDSDTGSEDSEDVEGFESVSLFDPLVFSLQIVSFPSNVVVPSRDSVPTLGANELVTPQFTEPNLSLLFPTGAAPAPAPITSTTFQTDAEMLSDLQGESEVDLVLPKEETVTIPTDADPKDIEIENKIIYELKVNF